MHHYLVQLGTDMFGCTNNGSSNVIMRLTFGFGSEMSGRQLDELLLVR